MLTVDDIPRVLRIKHRCQHVRHSEKSFQNTYNCESMVSALLLWQGAGIYSHLTLVVADEGAAVSLHNGRQCRCIEVPAGHPARQLIVPDAVVD